LHDFSPLFRDVAQPTPPDLAFFPILTRGGQPVEFQRACDECGKPYLAKRATSRFCGAACRMRVSRAGGRPRGIARAALGDLIERPTGLVQSVERVLDGTGTRQEVRERQAVQVAAEMAYGVTGSAVAALSKELDRLLDAALGAPAAAGDGLDELKARRDGKRAS